MSLNSDLQTLKTNIEGVKSTLYTNLTNKGVTNISESDTLSTLANKVSTITAGGSGVDFTQIGYSNEFSSELNSKMNADIAYSKTLLDAWNPSNTSAYRLYKSNKKLVYAPNIDTSNVNNMNSMFNGCSRLTSVPAFNTIKVTDMYSMFNGCTSLTSVPAFNTSKVTDMTGMFSGCSNITSVPELDTIKATTMNSMFNGCASITSVPAFNTINVNNMNNMFNGCTSLTSVPAFNTSNVTSMNSIFYNCTSLTSVPAFNTSKVTDMNNMFNRCTSLTTIEGISFQSYSASTMSSSYLVGYGTNNSIRKAVFKDIGYQSNAKQFNTENIANWGVNTSEIADARQSLIDSLITYSFDRATAGYPTCTIKLSSNTKALLTEDEKTQITAKGFTIA